MSRIFRIAALNFQGKNLESVRRSALPARRPQKLLLTRGDFLNINGLMAIKRCPYCRAIIDEKDQYCNNCGTQLLFPEDAAVEEEIKGEKIVDADVEEKDYEIPEPGETAPGTKESVEEEELEEDEAKPEEEVILIDEDTRKKGSERGSAELIPEGEAPSATLVRAPVEEEALPAPSAAPGAEIPAEGLPVIVAAERERGQRETEEGNVEKIENEPDAEEQVPAGTKPLTFDTRELDRIGRTAELGKEQVEKFLEVLKEREEESKARSIKTPESEDHFPPWASGMKEPVPASGFDGGDAAMDREEGEEREDLEAGEPLPESEEEAAEERDERPARRIKDSGIGLPEKVTQATLPFEKAIPREEIPAGGKVAPVREEGRYEEEAEEEEAARERPPFKLTVFLKAKSFDVLFVTVFWLASLWLAARSMDVTIFQMFGVVPAGLFVFLGALLVLYFFLFYFFLGETLGDRHFRDED